MVVTASSEHSYWLQRLRLLREIFTQQTLEAVATMIGCLPTQALAFLAVFVYATHATQLSDCV